MAHGPVLKPYALQPLLDRLRILVAQDRWHPTDNPAHQRVHQAAQRARHQGGWLSERAAESAADGLGLHVTELWPEWGFVEKRRQR